MWRTRQAPRFAATMHVSDSSMVSEVTPKLGLNLKADLRNPLTDKKRTKNLNLNLNMKNLSADDV